MEDSEARIVSASLQPACHGSAKSAPSQRLACDVAGEPKDGGHLLSEIAAGRVRILRPLDLPSGPCSDVDNETTSIGLVADVECTGLDLQRDKIIELAMRRFRFTADGTITKLDRPYAWLEDPGAPLSPFIAALTGLRDEDLRGQNIDERIATALLRSASVRICHNCAYDRPFIEDRLQGATGLAWACSMKEIDWRRRGLDGGGRSLGWLLTQAQRALTAGETTSMRPSRSSGTNRTRGRPPWRN
jgi:hypothetical protein